MSPIPRSVAMPAPVSRRRDRRPVPAALLPLALLFAGGASAHGGGLNAEGCHTNRKTGEYHCHRAPAAAPTYRPQTAAPTQFAPARSTLHRAAPAARRPYANCTEARAAGAAPVHRGDPGYGPHLDRDNDGIGCEPYRGADGG